MLRAAAEPVMNICVVRLRALPGWSEAVEPVPAAASAVAEVGR